MPIPRKWQTGIDKIIIDFAVFKQLLLTIHRLLHGYHLTNNSLTLTLIFRNSCIN